MRIVILGAGQVGASVAEGLVRERNDITVVDADAGRLAALGERLDLRTVHGHAAFPSVLEAAGARDADLLLAVTSSDETNIVACEIAKVLFNVPTKIARIRASEYWSHPQLFDDRTFPVDVLISPETLVTDTILRLIDYPGALRVQDFAGGRVRLVGVRARPDGLMAGRRICDFRRHMPAVDTRIAALYRRDRPVNPEGDTVIAADDEVFFIARSDDVAAVLRELGAEQAPYRRILIAGGGNIGLRLARALERRELDVKLIDHNARRTRYAAEQLERALVLHGDAADAALLEEEGIRETDLFIAVTNDDETNILSAMLARRLGARQTFALINRAAYVDLVESGTRIDVVISPQHSTIGSILAHVRAGDVAAVHSVRYGTAEAMELIVHGDRRNSKLIGRRLDALGLPPGVTVGALLRGDEVLIAHHDTVIQAEDHVIVFVTEKRRIREVERLFQVGFSFF